MEYSARCSIGYSPRFIMSFIQILYSISYNVFGGAHNNVSRT